MVALIVAMFFSLLLQASIAVCPWCELDDGGTHCEKCYYGYRLLLADAELNTANYNLSLIGPGHPNYSTYVEAVSSAEAVRDTFLDLYTNTLISKHL